MPVHRPQDYPFSMKSLLDYSLITPPRVEPECSGWRGLLQPHPRITAGAWLFATVSNLPTAVWLRMPYSTHQSNQIQTAPTFQIINQA